VGGLIPGRRVRATGAASAALRPPTREPGRGAPPSRGPAIWPRPRWPARAHARGDDARDGERMVTREDVLAPAERQFPIAVLEPGALRRSRCGFVAASCDAVARPCRTAPMPPSLSTRPPSFLRRGSAGARGAALSPGRAALRRRVCAVGRPGQPEIGR
jgi:hypothetical protein